MNKFNFVGEVIIPKDDERFFKVWGKKRDVEGNCYASIHFGIKANNSIAYVELFGSKSEEVQFNNIAGERISIPWNERLNPAMTNDAAYYNKHMCSINDETIEYVTSYDMAMKLKEVIPAYNGKLRVTGRITKSPYVSKEGKEMIITKYEIRNVYAVSENEKPSLKADYEFFYNKDSIINELKTEKKIFIEGYIPQYISDNSNAAQHIQRTPFASGANSRGQTIYIPQTFVLNAEKLNMEDEKMKKLLEYKIKALEKASSNKKIYKAMWECSIVSGAETIEFDESQLTEQQKLQIELGIATIDDFRPKGGIFGPRIDEIRLVKPILNGAYIDGTIEHEDETLDEFNEMILKFKKPEKFDEVVASANVETGTDYSSSVEGSSIDVDDLFS